MSQSEIRPSVHPDINSAKRPARGRAGGIAAVVIGGMLALGVTALPAEAVTCNNHGTSWESNLGSQVHGYVQICAAANDGGRHASRGCQRFTRQSGPSLDTGRMYTSSATSRTDGTVRYRSDWVWDSALWGDSYVTHWNWNVIWF